MAYLQLVLLELEVEHPRRVRRLESACDTEVVASHHFYFYKFRILISLNTENYLASIERG